MTKKTVEIAGVGTVTLVKRRSSRHLRLRIGRDGQPIVSMPAWVPYYAGKAFAEKNTDWISKHAKKPASFLEGQTVARSHNLVYLGVPSDRPTVRVKDNQIRVSIPDHLTPESPEVQAAITRGVKKAYQQEGHTLINRLQQLAADYGITYKAGQLKFMTSRWGSCKNDGTITLNYRLLDQPDDAIDYVITHELAHVRHHNHSKAFWDLVGELMPNYKQSRKVIKQANLTW